MSQAEDGSTSHGTDGSTPRTESWQNNHSFQQPRPPGPDPSQEMFGQARQRRKITKLEGKIETLESGRAAKERQTNYYLSQGRAYRRIVSLFDGIEDLVSENDRRYDVNEDDESATFDQKRLQAGYTILIGALPWLVKKAMDAENDEYIRMLKLLRQGADAARGDDTSKLKALISDWVNRELKPDPPIDHDDKHGRGFISDASVTELSFPTFLYEKYNANPDDLEEGLFKGKILVQGYKAVFTSPSSAKDIDGDGDGADVVRNNARMKNTLLGSKVKKHVAQIIKLDKVTPRSIAYIACQVRFALSSVTSWRIVDGDFNYIQFWRIIVDFFESPPGREAQRRVTKLLEWWTRKVFGRSQREDLSNAAKASMSVNALVIRTRYLSLSSHLAFV
ncbi:hypothetical protein DEU56DRAFT_916722 [Suillus clintonianus]|uniref:uncharacterized protein n=1 Tax=Suillus clintonianus TaxID=1904413 RepID=UPI001B86BB08|nr:uncharacterized protein DEU56DRAFT_916722 [Suillus clintonianus]KAG2125119.1 hypothetical protein DEU56DRAFT_916722 [Suillus clintonianus]